MLSSLRMTFKSCSLAIWLPLLAANSALDGKKTGGTSKSRVLYEAPLSRHLGVGSLGDYLFVRIHSLAGRVGELVCS